MKDKIEKAKLPRFLVYSLVGVFALILCIYIFLAFYINHRSAHTIEEVGKIYMESISSQFSLHYEVTVDTRLSQAREIGRAHV